jgi:hypothetical protein
MKNLNSLRGQHAMGRVESLAYHHGHPSPYATDTQEATKSEQTLPRMTADEILVAYHDSMREYYDALDNERPGAAELLAIAEAIYVDYDQALLNEFAPDTNRYAFVAHEEAPVSEVFHPNMYVTCWDDVIHTTPEEKEHAECEPMAHDLDCDCEACAPIDPTCPYCHMVVCDCAYRARVTGIPIGPIARAALEPQLITTDDEAAELKSFIDNLRSFIAGAALLAALLLPAHASAQEVPIVPTDGECVLTRTFEDGSATALCGHETWAYDADGGFIMDNGIVFYYRAPGTWYEVR